MHGRRWSAIMVASLVLITVAQPAGGAPAGTPRLRLRAASPTVELFRYGDRPVGLELGVYLVALDAPFDLRVSRDSYDDPVRVRQAFHRPGGLRFRELPSDILAGWWGLDRFLRFELLDRDGNVLRRRVTDACPAGWESQRVNDSGPFDPTYPTWCGGNPLTMGAVWGIDEGWAVAPQLARAAVRIPDGRYRARVSIMPRYRELFGVSSDDAIVEVGVRIRTGSGCDFCEPAAATAGSSGSDSLTPATTTDHPRRRSLPDLVALPAFGIGTASIRGRDYLQFGADVWNRGPASLVVEGFRVEGEPRMDAYQYFSIDGEIVGRAPVGAFDFDERDGHRHWHFLQFARYRLLDASQENAVRSRKQSFCLAPTDAIDLTVDGGVWRPESLGFSRCGWAESLWIREVLPTGWGDTYYQGVPGQSFDITGLPNGTYWIEVHANPLGALFDADATNDVELREVTLRGRPGARRVTVPPWHGLDTEAWFGGGF